MVSITADGGEVDARIMSGAITTFTARLVTPTSVELVGPRYACEMLAEELQAVRDDGSGARAFYGAAERLDMLVSAMGLTRAIAEVVSASNNPGALFAVKV